MSGYTAQITTILVVNIAAAYAAVVPPACVQLDPGISGFMAMGAYTSAVLSGHDVPSGLSTRGCGGVQFAGDVFHLAKPH